MRYRFGEFEVDAGRFTLSRDGAPVRIEPRPLTLLIHLLERHPDAVPREELLERLWPDAVVLEGSLTRAVREVRRALRERADEEGAIRTVRGRGYAISGHVERLEAAGGTARTVSAEARAPAAGPAAEAGPERRLLAILSADMADYAGHAGRDAGRIEARLGALREAAAELISAHRGLLVHFVADNLLGVFASAVDATRAALAFHACVAEEAAAHPGDAPMAFRTGLHLAELIEDGGRVYGGGVHIAGRLERLAAPGGVCLSAAVRDQVVGRLELALEDLGERDLKGFAEPIRVYRLAPSAAGRERS